MEDICESISPNYEPFLHVASAHVLARGVGLEFHLEKRLCNGFEIQKNPAMVKVIKICGFVDGEDDCGEPTFPGPTCL